MKLLLLIFSISFIFIGCATKYQEKSFTGGFTETQLAKNIFIVNFRGNAFTSKERATDFMLLRSAELTLVNGFKYFVIVDSDYKEDIQIHSTPSTTTTTYKGTLNSNSSTHINAINYNRNTQANINTNTYGTIRGTATTIHEKGNSTVYKKPITSNRIICFSNKPNTKNEIYEATFLQTSIKNKYNIK